MRTNNSDNLTDLISGHASYGYSLVIIARLPMTNAFLDCPCVVANVPPISLQDPMAASHVDEVELNVRHVSSTPAIHPGPHTLPVQQI